MQDLAEWHSCGHLNQRAKGAAIPEIFCFEKQEDWGGQWNNCWRTGMDADGEQLVPRMYRHLWSDGPRNASSSLTTPLTNILAAPFPPSRPRGPFRLHQGPRRKIRCPQVRPVQHRVAPRQLRRSHPGVHAFRARPENRASETHVFDKLVVATGHFSVPNIPEFEGINTFPGEVLHAHDFRGAERFVGKDLLMIGCRIRRKTLACRPTRWAPPP